MIRSLHITVCLVLLSWGTVFANEVSVYLLPRVTVESDIIMLKDVARLEVRGGTPDEIGNIVIDKTACKDGLIDRQEIKQILRRQIHSSIFVYGSAVRIMKEGGIQNSTRSEAASQGIKQGEQVSIISRKRNIQVTVKGKVIKGGAVGDTVSVKLQNKRIVRGRIIGDRLVEIGI